MDGLRGNIGASGTSNNGLNLSRKTSQSMESNDVRDEDIRESMAEKNDRSINLPTGYILATKSNSKSILTQTIDT